MKIVGIGLPKTGTKTLRECFLSWGLKHQSWELDCFRLLLDESINEIMHHVEQFDSFDDCPWYLLYREIDERFPGSKFILTRRITPTAWFDSYCKWADRFGPDLALKIREHVFGYSIPQGHKADYVRTYLSHNENVREYFRDKPNQLIELCWEESHGWAELANFLGFSIPKAQFPHANKSSLNEIGI